MPSYNFIVKESGVEITEFMKHSEIEAFLESNPHLQRGVERPGIINHNLLGVKGVKSRPDEGFREVLQKTKAAHPLGVVNTW